MTHREEFDKAVDAIAETVWLKYGPEGALYHSDSAAAYEEIKSLVKFSSWIVSPVHLEMTFGFTKQFHYAVTGIHQAPFSAEQAIKGMIQLCCNRFMEIHSKNEVFYYKVHFVVQKRFLAHKEIYDEGDAPGPPLPPKGRVGLIEDATFIAHIDAEEAAEEFCRAYLIAGMVPPKIQIVAFNSNHEEIPKPQQFLPVQIKNKFPYTKADIPEWCQLPMHEHEVAGGCWGISSGQVAQKGKDHCHSCLFNRDILK